MEHGPAFDTGAVGRRRADHPRGKGVTRSISRLFRRRFSNQNWRGLVARARLACTLVGVRRQHHGREHNGLQATLFGVRRFTLGEVFRCRGGGAESSLAKRRRPLVAHGVVGVIARHRTDDRTESARSNRSRALSFISLLRIPHASSQLRALFS